MNEQLTVPVIGYMRSLYIEKFGIPRQPNLVNVQSCIELQPPYNDVSAFTGIEQFSHLWLLWHFHDNKNTTMSQQTSVPNAQQQAVFRPMIRPPRLGGNQKIGVFASRSMYRPAAIGLSVVQFLRLEQVGTQLKLWVSGADLLNGTPIIDIKPYIAYSDAVLDASSGYAQAQPSPKTVLWTAQALQTQQQLTHSGQCSLAHITALNEVLALDPRPAYQQDSLREYGLSFATFNVRFTVNDTQVIVHSISMLEGLT